jgi:dTDP-4-amino-4,6-dideoxygalactose transaminase
MTLQSEATLRPSIQSRQPRVTLLDLTREYGLLRDEMLASCERVLDRMHLLGGNEVKSFEAEMAAYLGVEHVRGVASGTDALWLALRALGVGRGDEVLVQANAFVAAVEAIHDVDAMPVPIDVRSDDLGPDPALLANAIGPRTRAIVVVHLYGMPVEMQPILDLARRHDLLVLEDCSHAHGARLRGACTGTFGHLGAFSLGVVKNLAAYGDAGMVTTRDGHLAALVGHLGTHGQVNKNEHSLYGTNSRLDELHAAMLRVKLQHLDARNRRRREIAAYYDGRLGGCVVTPFTAPDRESVYHQYVIRTPQREALRASLAADGIDTGIHYPTPIHRQPAWQRTVGPSPSLPVAERTAKELLSLPVYPDLTDAEVERVADAVSRFFS